MSLASPVSKPRLPSPPPFTEVQIGPKSPGMSAETDTSNTKDDDLKKSEQGAVRRVRPGTKAADMASGPPLKPLTEVSIPKAQLGGCEFGREVTDFINRLIPHFSFKSILSPSSTNTHAPPNRNIPLPS